MGFANRIGNVDQAGLVLRAHGEQSFVGVEEVLARRVDLNTTLTLKLSEHLNEEIYTILRDGACTSGRGCFCRAKFELGLASLAKRSQPRNGKSEK